jgi:uncharacterized protein YlaN (UPF0358 family)
MRKSLYCSIQKNVENCIIFSDPHEKCKIKKCRYYEEVCDAQMFEFTELKS